MFCTGRCYEKTVIKGIIMLTLRHLLNMPKAACTESGKDRKPAYINTAGHAHVWPRFCIFQQG